MWMILGWPRKALDHLCRISELLLPYVGAFYRQGWVFDLLYMYNRTVVLLCALKSQKIPGSCVPDGIFSQCHGFYSSLH